MFGPSLAKAIYETTVRAGFNMMICASYVDILNPDEKRLIDIASSRGLYITTHHQEPVGAGALQLDLHFPEIKGTTYASHPDLWRKAWRRYIGEWAKVPDVAFNECAEQIKRASKELDEAQKRQLFEQFGYPAQFMQLSSGAFSEMSYALAAMDLKDDECALHHAKIALEMLEKRDELDKRYNSGKWEHWYDRDLIYPCRSVTDKLRKAVNGQ